MVAPSKTGNTLILDRLSGKANFEYRLEGRESSLIPGERTSPYQPNISIPEPFENIFVKKMMLEKSFKKIFI